MYLQQNLDSKPQWLELRPARLSGKMMPEYILSALCSEEQLEDLLWNCDTRRRVLLEQIKTECLAKGSDPADRVQEAEIRLLADFHAKVKTLEDKLMKETSKLESSEPSKMEVSPDKSFDVSKTQDPDQNESCVLGKLGARLGNSWPHVWNLWCQLGSLPVRRTEVLKRDSS